MIRIPSKNTIFVLQNVEGFVFVIDITSSLALTLESKLPSDKAN